MIWADVHIKVFQCKILHHRTWCSVWTMKPTQTLFRRLEPKNSWQCGVLCNFCICASLSSLETLGGCFIELHSCLQKVEVFVVLHWNLSLSTKSIVLFLSRSIAQSPKSNELWSAVVFCENWNVHCLACFAFLWTHVAHNRHTTHIVRTMKRGREESRKCLCRHMVCFICNWMLWRFAGVFLGVWSPGDWVPSLPVEPLRQVSSFCIFSHSWKGNAFLALCVRRVGSLEPQLKLISGGCWFLSVRFCSLCLLSFKSLWM